MRRSAFTSAISGPSCKTCYTLKRKCQYSAGVYQGCIQCETTGIKCEPRECSSSKYTMDVFQAATGSKGCSVTGSALGLYVPEPIGSDRALFDDRGFDISTRARRRHRSRTSHSVDASVSIGAIQIAGTTPLVRRGLLQPSELVELYHLFITRWNPCILVLDPGLHTLEYLVQSELLLSVVLAVAAQDYQARPKLYEKLTHYARSIAGKELLETPRVETVQALIMLSLFPNWGKSLDQNRSWLDLGLALDLANQLEIEKVVSGFDPYNSSPIERNIFRTWMICHNLDAITSSVFGRPSSLGPMPPEHRRRPRTANDSCEGIVWVLTEPLQLLELHIRQQSLNTLLYGTDSFQGINQESNSSPQLLDPNTFTTMGEETTEQRDLYSSEQGALLPFWLHMAKIATAYSRLLLFSRHPSADQSLQVPKYRSKILDSATSILESYSDLFDSCSYAKYAPGCLFTYGLLATAVIHKFIGDTESGIPQGRVATLIERFSNNLRLSPTVTRAETHPGIFIQTLNYIERNKPHRSGEIPESLAIREPLIPMLTTVFPGWWRLYL
ncbi:hypothetical protein OPQ81_001006 [Rhizoctonia solani]|nr:hypothetical protein OPQ81_001006 [Rhizoctonia solani]